MTESRVLIESGHYYQVKGPTEWSKIGVEIAEELKSQHNAASMLFIDDYHGIENVSEHEINHPVIDLNFTPDYTVYESDMVKPALVLLEVLKELPKKRRARQDKNGAFFLSGFPITDRAGNPLCVLLDAALTQHKYELGFQRSINVLPSYYGGLQANLSKIINKLTFSEFKHETVLFDYDKRYRFVTENEESVEA